MVMEPWSYLRGPHGEVHHLIGRCGSLLHTVIEYASGFLEGEARWRRVPCQPEIARLGLSTTPAEIGRSHLHGTIRQSPCLAMKVTGLLGSEVRTSVSSCHLLDQVVNGSVDCPETVLADLTYLLDYLGDLGFRRQQFGLMGSIGFGWAHERSDIDIMLHVQSADEAQTLREAFLRIEDSTLVPFRRSSFGRATIFDVRRHYMPLEASEMIFHENRRMTAFLERSGQTPRKVTLFPVLTGYDPIGIVSGHANYASVSVETIEGRVTDDRLACVLGAAVTIMPRSPEWLSRRAQEVCLVDAMGNYTDFFRHGEYVRARGRLLVPESDSPAIMMLAHWSDHIAGGFYAKSLR